MQAHRKNGLAGAIVTVALIFGAVRAGATPLIDFEPDINGKLPDGTVATDDLAIFNQYFVSHGVMFGIDNDLDGLPDMNGAGLLETPFLEHVGDDGTNGFMNDTLGVPDTAANTPPGLVAQLGDWFLRTSGGTSNLLITYTTPTAQAGGEIWDIDGFNNQFEQWRVEALDTGLNVIDSVLSPLGTNTALDGRPWLWSFNHGSNLDIQAIRLHYVGQTTTPRGIAFNNFTPVNVPEPGTLALLLLGLGALRRRTTHVAV